MEDPHQFHPAVSFRLRLIYTYCAVSLSIIGLATLWLHDSRIAHEKLAVATTSNLVQALEHSIVLTFDRIDHALMAVVDEVLRHKALGKLDGISVDGFLDRLEERLGGVSFLMADAEGTLVYGRIVRQHGAISVSDRDYFIRARDTHQNESVISKPFTGRLTGITQIAVARRIVDPAGQFIGVVFALIPLNQFTEQFSKIDIGSNGLVVLRDNDAALIARYPPLAGDLGRPGSIAISHELKEIRSSGQKEASYKTVSPTDGISRIYSFQVVRGRPLFLIAGIALDDALENWWDGVVFYSWVGTLMLGALGLSVGWLVHIRKKEEYLIAKQKQAQQSLTLQETAMRSAANIIVITDVDGNIQWVNPAFTKNTGYHMEEAIGKNPRILKSGSPTSCFFLLTFCPKGIIFTPFTRLAMRP